MPLRGIALLFVVVVAGLAFLTWPRRQAAGPEAPPAPTEAESMPAPSAPGSASVEAGPATSDPGLQWTVPRRWVVAPARAMRVATYTVPAATGDVEGAECAVFYFGAGQGGGVEDNLDRWIAQFEVAGKPTRAMSRVHDLPVARVKVAGTYLAPGGPTMESQGRKPNYELLGAIVSGPNGNVFFKLVGPARTVAGAAAELDRMLGSLRRR